MRRECMPGYGAVLLAIAAGVAAALQPPVNTALASHVGPLAASTISFITGGTVLVLSLAVVLGWSGICALPAQLSGEPLWLYLGGLMGVVVVTAVIYAVPVLGTGTTIGLLVAAQMITSMVADHFGVAGGPVTPVTWIRVLGALLIIVGARLVLLRPGS
jgi:transporter family-2 protein